MLEPELELTPESDVIVVVAVVAEAELSCIDSDLVGSLGCDTRGGGLSGGLPGGLSEGLSGGPPLTGGDSHPPIEIPRTLMQGR